MVARGASAVRRYRYTPPFARKPDEGLTAAMALYDEAVREDALAALQGEAEQMADELEAFTEMHGCAPSAPRRFWWQDAD